jgi:hypothetical protein
MSGTNSTLDGLLFHGERRWPYAFTYGFSDPSLAMLHEDTNADPSGTCWVDYTTERGGREASAPEGEQ